MAKSQNRHLTGSNIVVKPFQGSGLPGFCATCPQCGLQMQNTIEANVRLDVEEHLAYHARKEQS